MTSERKGWGVEDPRRSESLGASERRRGGARIKEGGVGAGQKEAGRCWAGLTLLGQGSLTSVQMSSSLVFPPQSLSLSPRLHLRI